MATKMRPKKLSVAFGYLVVLSAFLFDEARIEARPVPSHIYCGEAQARRHSVIDYFYLLPSLGIGGSGTRQEKRELLQADNRPVIDVRHDYLLVHPDSSPAEEIAIFRGRNNADLVADSLPDYQSDYNAFTVYRLKHGRLRDVTQQVLPMPPDTDHLLYELPRFGTTIRVFRFDLDRETRRHVFDLQWRAGRFVKIQ